MYANDMERVRVCFELNGVRYQGFIRPCWLSPDYIFSVVLNTQWLGNLTSTSTGWQMVPAALPALVDYLGDYVILWFE